MALLSLSRSSRSLSGRSRPLAWCSYDRHSSPAKLTFFKQLLRSIAAIGKQWGSAGHINNKGFLLWGAFSGAFLGGGGEIVSRRKCFGERRSSRNTSRKHQSRFPLLTHPPPAAALRKTEFAAPTEVREGEGKLQGRRLETQRNRSERWRYASVREWDGGAWCGGDDHREPDRPRRDPPPPSTGPEPSPTTRPSLLGTHLFSP